MRLTSSWSWIAIACLALAASTTRCRQPAWPMVEEAGAGVPPRQYSVKSLTGKRDGSRVNARLVLEPDAAGNRLDLDLVLDLGPPIRLAGGRYSFKVNGRLLEGKVEAPSIDFQAGQSSGMNLGGRFELLGENGTPHYSLTLPTTPFDAAYR